MGASFVAAFCAWIQFAGPGFGSSWQIYAVSALNGIAGTTLVIAALSMISDLTSTQAKPTAFVFGAISFTDKLANGISVFLLEEYLPKKTEHGANEFYKTLIVTIAAIGCFVILVGFLALLRNPELGRKSTKKELREFSRKL